MNEESVKEKSISRNYRDLLVWQKGIQLTKRIYMATACFPVSEMYGLSNQLRRAGVSVPSNIAEGQSRQSLKEFKHFLYISQGSLSEIDTQLVIASELGFLAKDDFTSIEKDILELRKMLYGLIKSLPNA